MSTLRQLLYGLAEKYLLLLLGLASSMVLARVLSPKELGIYSLAATFVGLAHVLRDLGANQMLVTARRLDAGLQRRALTFTVLSAWLLAALLALAAAPVAAFYRQPEVAQVLRILALNFLVVPISSHIMALLRRDMRGGAILLINCTHGAVQCTAGVALAVLGLGPCALALASLAANGLACCVACCCRPPGLDWRPLLTGMRGLLRYSALASGSSVMDEIGVAAPELIAGRLLGAEQVALLSKAQSLLSLFNQAVTSAVSPVVLPLLARHEREGGDPLRAWLAAAESITALAWPFFIFSAIYADLLVHLLYGGQWQACVPLIRIMALGAALYSMFNMSRYLLLATGQLAAQARIDALAVAWRLPMLLAGAAGGLAGLALAIAASLVLRCWLAYRTIEALFGRDFARFIRHFRKSALASAAAAAPWLLAQLTSWGQDSQLLQAAYCAVAGLLCWAVALGLQGHPLAKLVIQAARPR